MKKIMVMFILLLIISVGFVKAESFVEGNFISGEYISKRKDGAIHYMTVQYLKDSNGNIVYCLEPYTKFVEGKSYTSFEGDISGYNDLSEAQKRKISLIVYYGYGYGSRNTSKWYAITQYLIWDTVTNGNGTIYFTDKLNGNKIEKYTTEINDILSDVNNHDKKPSGIYDRTINYHEGIVVNGVDKDNYEVVNSSYKYTFNNDLRVSDIRENGSIEFRKISNYYKNRVAIFDSTQSQDLIRPGNVNNPVYKMNVNVLKGNLILDIKKDDSVYTVESDFSNTCYDVFRNGVIVDSVCTSNDNLVYQTVDLSYGDYEIVQKSVGIGYKKDENIYKVFMNANNPKPVINLNNLLLRNDIEIKKYACKDQVCNPESDAKFSVLDIKGNLVNNIVTDKEGHAKIELGYGTYKIKQISGLYKYSEADEYSEKIIDEDASHFKELFNYYIENKEEEEEEKEDNTLEKPKPKEVKQEEKEKPEVLSDVVENEEVVETVDNVEVPDTGIENGYFNQLFLLIGQLIFGIIIKIEKNI
jgi:hypothetical protein